MQVAARPAFARGPLRNFQQQPRKFSDPPTLLKENVTVDVSEGMLAIVYFAGFSWIDCKYATSAWILSLTFFSSPPVADFMNASPHTGI